MPTNLSLGALGKAVGANGDTTTQTALAGDGRGSTGTATSLSDFYISSIDAVSLSDSTPNESSGPFTATITFSDAGDLFISHIASENGNFDWSEGTNHRRFTLTTDSDYTADFNTGAVIGNTAFSIKCTFEDSFNTSATNYNTELEGAGTILNVGGGGGS